MLRTKVVAIITSSRPFIQTAEATLQSEGHLVEVFESLKEALAACQTRHFDAVILDVSARPPRDETSFSRLSQQVGAHRIWLAPPLGLSPWVQDAETLGIHHFLKVPVQRPELEEMLTELSQLAEEFAVTREPDHDARSTSGRYHLEEIGHNRYFLAASPAMMRIYENIRLLAAVDVPVLILGESGVGKDVVANLLHKHSRRSSHMFSSVNCAALPPDLLESELFGYVKGAFTGANQNKRGLFEVADCGTIFLDEIGEMSLSMQVKLLRVLQERCVRPVGGTAEVAIDVRVIAATNRDLERQIAENGFREDLYYRLNVIPIVVPPLRERREDVPLLVNHFVKKYAKSAGRSIAQVLPESLTQLSGYEWPGNVRQLENTIERSVALETGEVLRVQLPVERARAKAAAAGVGGDAVSVPTDMVLPEGMDMEKYVAEIERALLKSALQQSNGVQTRAADVLRISYRSFRHLMKKYDL